MWACFILIACCIPSSSLAFGFSKKDHKDNWQVHAGEVNAALERFVQDAGEKGWHVRGISIMQHGRDLAEWKGAEGTAAPISDQQELSGTVTAMAVGLAVDEGLLSLDDKVAAFFADLLPAQPSANLQAMTVRHLLTMTSGHDRDTTCGEEDNWVQNYLAQPVPHTPGTYFYYDPMAGYMLSAILQKVTGQTLSDYLRPRLFEPLGIRNVEWETSPQGICAGGWGLNTSTRDMARIGSLLVQKGKWEDRRILPRKWVKQMISYQTDSCPRDVRYEELPQSGLSLSSNDWIQGFGYQMWHCRTVSVADGIELWNAMGIKFSRLPNPLCKLLRAEGKEGMMLVVCPEFEACIAVDAEKDNGENGLHLLYSHLLPAIPDWRGTKEDISRSRTRQHNLHYVNAHL